VLTIPLQVPYLGKPLISLRARKFKSDMQEAMNKNSNPVQKFFLRGGRGERCPIATEIFPNFWNCPKPVKLGSSYSGYRLL